MEPPTAISHEVTEDGWVVLSFLSSAARDRHWVEGQLSDPLPVDPARVVGSLGVRYRKQDPDDPASTLTVSEQVSLYLPQGITPTSIRRFAWSRWLDVADAIARAKEPEEGPHPSWFESQPAASSPPGKLKRATYAEHGVQVHLRRRPGRKGHPPEFYQEIANHYQELRRSGVRSPTKTIAEQMHYSRDTVAGWVRRARELGFLTPARRGRPG